MTEQRIVVLTIKVTVRGQELDNEKLKDFQENLSYDVTSETDGVDIMATEITDMELQ